MLHNATTLLLKLLQMMHIQQQFSVSYDPELHLLVGGPQSHRVRAGCFVNSVKFVMSERDEGHVTQKNGVMVDGLYFNYTWFLSVSSN